MSESIAIHIFNPETDYALAAGRTVYNPPVRILRLRDELAFIPALYASPNDWIATFGSPSPLSDDGRKYLDIASGSGLRIIPVARLRKEMDNNSGSSFRINPWGWNHSLLLSLTKAGIDANYLKTAEEIDEIRTLSHRRTCIAFQKGMKEMMPEIDVPVAQEIHSPDDASVFLKDHGDAFFKLPWSSSGRGILYVCGTPDSKTLEWIAGGIRRQGSVMAEKAFRRRLDFATEWECRDGNVFFCGLSVFRTSPDGRYAGNIIAPQTELSGIVSEASGEWNPEIVDVQKKLLETMIAPRYSGPVGIDMLATTDGHIDPCVEINLRMTMGMVALAREKRNL